MKLSDEVFRELEGELRITEKSKDQLRNKILQNANLSKKRNLRPYGWIAGAICMLFIITSPVYSTTMASIASKILPISIDPSFSENKQNLAIGDTEQLYKLIEKEGYIPSSVGILPPFTIEISLILEDTTLNQAKADLEPTISKYLYDKGYDDYKLKISESTEALSGDQENAKSSIYDKVSEIVKEKFKAYGYAEEAEYELAGLKETWFSYIVTIEMPDHIQESTEIIAAIETEIESQNLDVKDIEVNTFNFEHRQQDDRWGLIASDIYDSMSGKSTFHLTGVSYKVKKGHSYISIRTNLDKRPSEGTIKKIKFAIEEYFALPETKEQIQNDNYTIQFLLMNEKSFLKISN
jgi:hypothetical protein